MAADQLRMSYRRLVRRLCTQVRSEDQYWDPARELSASAGPLTARIR